MRIGDQYPIRVKCDVASSHVGTPTKSSAGGIPDCLVNRHKLVPRFVPLDPDLRIIRVPPNQDGWKGFDPVHIERTWLTSHLGDGAACKARQRSELSLARWNTSPASGIR